MASPWKRAIRRLLGLALSPALMSYWKIGAFIFAVIAISATLLSSALQMSPLDATYFVTTTITTVGYGDYNFSTAPASIKIFGICLMLIGAGSLAVLFSSVTEALFTKRMINAFGGMPVPRGNHLILVGAGHLGSRIATALIKSDIPFVIVENDTTGRYSVDVKRQTSVIDGDPRSIATLCSCNVDSAAAIMTISDDDVENLSIALSAKTANQKLRTIVRVFDPNLAAGLQESLMLDSVLSISRNAAPYFVSALVADNVHTAIQWADSLVFVAEKTVDAMVIPLGSYSAPGLPDVVVGAIPLGLHSSC
jgi:Trk K+ transport system NAD-binding subunit